MSHNHQHQELAGGANLEDRLRGLIMNNSPSPVTQDQRQPVAPAFVPTLPPHMRGASLAQQQDYLQRSMMRTQGPPAQPIQQAPPQKAPQTTHKRLNQYQRRQLASQMAVPVNDKASVSAAPQGSPGFHGNQRLPHRPPGIPQNSVMFQQQSEQITYQQDFQRGPMPQPVVHRGQVLQDMHVRGPPPGLGGEFRGQAPGYHQGYPQQQWQQDRQNFQQDRQNLQQGPQQFQQRPPPQNRQLFNPGAYGAPLRTAAPYGVSPEQISAQSDFLESLVQAIVPHVGVNTEEIAEKEAFRAKAEQVCRDAVVKYEKEELGNLDFVPESVQLTCFGSMASGYATKGSDMDLALLSPLSKIPPESSESPIPRILEKALLDWSCGARLLTRTRVPIIKLCEKPTEKLRTDLLQERLKWENGFDVDEPDEDVVEEDLEAVEKAEVSEDTEKPTVAIIEKVKTAEEIYAETLASFRQKKNLSLGDYYGLAKRLLRQLGGRDVGAAYGTNPTEDEVRILADVCEAFVNGLENQELRDQLVQYKSLVFDRIGNPATAKSLGGVYQQIEGERLAMAWTSRPLPEMTERSEGFSDDLVKQWRTLLDCNTAESAVYNRRLHQSLEKLKKIASLQLVFLEHQENESAAQYYARVCKLLLELGGKDEPGAENTALAIVITHYINGARGIKIREALQSIVSRNPPLSLSTIGLHHRILELARDFEKALAKNIYQEADRPYVEKYISLLLSASASTEVSAPLLPSTPGALPILGKIATLPDPTHACKPRDRYHDHLEFPKTKIGIQCDINFAASLALHNTALLRCYSLTDPRIKPMILFVKHWAKRRAINTPYRGTLSSYGYVLMVLHYLVNIAQPPVAPNLQHHNPPPHAPTVAPQTCQGANVTFWRDERELTDLARRGLLNHNGESVGALLRGFFEYYAQNGPMSSGGGRGFDWGREVLSLRTRGGLLTKQEKGWVGARTVTQTTTEAAPAATTAASGNGTGAPGSPGAARKVVRKEEVKEIRHRYLFALEDPFELEHNVARTVTHNGIVAIRDEFRRALRVVRGVGRGGKEAEGLLDEVKTEEGGKEGLVEAMKVIHGLGEEFGGGTAEA
ncbi:hypothetical protein V496_09333 [Pseudogymnoascus sp. VKM F-4515 (FW-2607)]|nr:hypothetical protein V496_09333 [Pseudogymnoascus sp. VKM F-4515 (FW-2607)]